MAVQLRTFIFLNSLQPQLASYIAATSSGFLPIPGEASLWIEVAPGMVINRITDVAQKSTSVRPGVQVVERAFGVLEIHSPRQDDVLEAGRQVLSYLNIKEENRVAPRVVSSEVITDMDPYQCMLINRFRKGNLLLPGQSLYILEVDPAAYIVLAANEAEKASPVNLVDVESIGAYGRLYMGGTESTIAEAVKAAEQSLRTITGIAAPPPSAL